MGHFFHRVILQALLPSLKWLPMFFFWLPNVWDCPLSFDPGDFYGNSWVALGGHIRLARYHRTTRR